ncbi:MAG TPA: GlsB/YeaQ/YmgE family stress response membrane protein [Acidimicrobiia bacterium]|nr:GlsB/YeaQ/YmgE family stress response membrane protein [Acidimicrobiia bacterium]
MGVLSWVVVGLVAGALAGVATGKRVKGCLPTILIGVLGALLGGAVFSAAGQDGINDFGLWSIFVAFIGASVLLLVFGGRFDERRRR